MDKNYFSKRVLTRFIQMECERQLFLDLARPKPGLWLRPNREIEKPTRLHKGDKNLEELGRKYEQMVYSQLISFKDVIFKKDNNNEVTSLELELTLDNIHKILSSKTLDYIILLEAQYNNPESFFRDLFELKNPVDSIPIEYQNQRPDILIIGNVPYKDSKEPIRELLADGTVRTIPKTELDARFGISAIDIKNIREINIGKKQFTEIIYYLWTLSYFLKEKNLDNKFFVRVDGNGIFPKVRKDELDEIKVLEDIIDNTILIHWEDSFRNFTNLTQKIKELWKKSPCAIKSIPVNIQVGCGYCFYIEDCKKSLGMDGKTLPKDWSLKLIPYTSMSIAQQLIERGFKTIGDVADNIGTIKVGSVPEPIYPELPLLELKARALVEDKLINPPPDHVHAYSIPKYSSIAINFAVETDPANQRVYTAGLFLFMSVSSKAPFSLAYDNWWRIWKESLELSKDTKTIHKELNEYLIREIPLELVEAFLYYLKKLKHVLIYLKGEKKKDGTTRQQTVVIYQYASVNEGDTDTTEAEFSTKILLKLNYLLEFCNIIENFIVTDAKQAGRYYGPTTSLFYWSRRQLSNFQDMLERNLDYIINHPKAFRAFESIMSLFTPSDSEVTHPYQHKKLFNLQGFAETIFGFPSIISYTWHRIAKRELNAHVNRRFWIPHFNYMDFNNWYEYLLETDPTKKIGAKSQIQRQLMFKVRTINSLRMEFQAKYSKMISKYSRVINKSMIKSVYLPSDFHPIAQVWYLFSKYTGAIEEMEVEYFRTIYPEFSIGKLAAGKVDSLQIVDDADGKIMCLFNLIDLSSNMKVKEGDRVILIPDDKRNMKSSYEYEKCKITLKEMIWYSKFNGYVITTEKLRSKFLKEYTNKEKNHTWFLYPHSMDTWSRKLFGNNGLLERNNFGTSWLGARLSFLWNIRSNPQLDWPSEWEFLSPPVYLFAPQLLYDLKTPALVNVSKDLITPIDPYPDFSQQKAINLALENTICGIQGPPGTGKSQTIAALVDEYYLRSKKLGRKSVKILITCFSYAALRVIIDKIREGKSKAKKPTETSRLQMIFLRSEYQRSIINKAGLRDVDDLVRKGTTWKLNGATRVVTSTKPLEESLEENFILFANAHQLYNLNERVNDDFAFDLIVVDEASQLPVQHFMSSLQFTHNNTFVLKTPTGAKAPNTPIVERSSIANLELDDDSRNNDLLTKIVIVGDYNQLPPVQQINPPKNLETVLESLFSYYVKSHGIPNYQLKVNYRSNQVIVDYTSLLGIYKDLRASKENASRMLTGDINLIEDEWVKEILDPQKIVSCIIHDTKYEIGVSLLEAEIVTKITIGYYDMCQPKTEKEEIDFWTEKLGVVAPHNAQGRIIVRRLFDELTNLKKRRSRLKNQDLMKQLRNTVYSVEKFQGSDRDLIVSSIGLSDRDQLESESEFIYNLNRFNVLTSRAKSKIVLVASKEFLNFIPNDRHVMEQAAKIRKFALDFCDKEKSLDIIIKERKEVLYRYR